jgi:hypothetical protein
MAILATMRKYMFSAANLPTEAPDFTDSPGKPHTFKCYDEFVTACRSVFEFPLLSPRGIETALQQSYCASVRAISQFFWRRYRTIQIDWV